MVLILDLHEPGEDDQVEHPAVPRVRRTASSCPRDRGLDADVSVSASLREPGKAVEARRGLLQLEPGSSANGEIGVDGLSHGDTSSGQGGATIWSKATSTLA